MIKKADDAIFIIGMAVICGGVSMINVPAAVILAGIFCLLVSFSIYRSRKGGNK